MPKYDLGDIIYVKFHEQNFMVVGRISPVASKALISRYNLLSLDTGRYMMYFTQDIDSNSCLIA